MDTIAFIIALLVAIVLIWWYALNEERKAGGSIGIFAIRDEASKAADASAPETVRYRPRERVGRQGGGLRPDALAETYRMKPARRASSPIEDDAAVEADKEY
jgi:hypothetical protein